MIRARGKLRIFLGDAAGVGKTYAMLEAGADDYLTKPFGAGELLARVRVAMRRMPASMAEPVLTTGELTVDLGRRASATVSGKPLSRGRRAPRIMVLVI